MTASFSHLFYPFQSVETAQKLLKASYQKQQIEQYEQKSYHNSYSFIYYVEHGLTYLQQANSTPTSIKPVLMFYGMVQLIKACLLTVDPSYPESTSVLAHGVSTRKRKKQSYEFIQDEVKVQKNGLFSHFSDKMFHVKQTEGTKYSMRDLLFSIPELETTIKITKNKAPFLFVGKVTDEFVKVPLTILDDYKMTKDRFVQYFIKQAHYNLDSATDKYLQFKRVENPVANVNYSPLLYNHQKDTLYIPRRKEQLTFFPEILSHYLLLYNLSMICRYETEWWGELLHTFNSSDLSLINELLDVASLKIPYYLHGYLLNTLGIDREA
ncbi:YaaC family protein [Sutcliffiella horikoshii]|uniref:YaaC family protein n=1 Tax=Sutcliffiella horikoshii TaxID=79883 RepID=UPI00203FE726|nr:YaaC family protein [Sutcliffiella horikoshii]MCM3620576.1 YaaC family protein [Sutcliffiella horikoshii]